MVEKSSDFAIAALPPLPTPKKPAGAEFGSAGMAPLTMRPQLSIRCIATGGAAARCDRLGRDGAFEISADEDLASPVTLRFRRLNSGREGEVRLAQLKRGNSGPHEYPGGYLQRRGPGGIRYPGYRRRVWREALLRRPGTV